MFIVGSSNGSSNGSARGVPLSQRLAQATSFSLFYGQLQLPLSEAEEALMTNFDILALDVSTPKDVLNSTSRPSSVRLARVSLPDLLEGVQSDSAVGTAPDGSQVLTLRPSLDMASTNSNSPTTPTQLPISTSMTTLPQPVVVRKGGKLTAYVASDAPKKAKVFSANAASVSRAKGQSLRITSPPSRPAVPDFGSSSNEFGTVLPPTPNLASSPPVGAGRSSVKPLPAPPSNARAQAEQARADLAIGSKKGSRSITRGSKSRARVLSPPKSPPLSDTGAASRTSMDSTSSSPDVPAPPTLASLGNSGGTLTRRSRRPKPSRNDPVLNASIVSAFSTFMPALDGLLAKGFDGVFFVGGDQLNDEGKVIAGGLFQLLDDYIYHAVVAQPNVVVPSFFLEDAQEVFNSVRTIFNGVCVTSSTVEDGTGKPTFSIGSVQESKENYLSALLKEAQQRPFRVLAVERSNAYEPMRGELYRFVQFCKTRGILGAFSTNAEHDDIDSIFALPLNAVGATDLLRDAQVASFRSAFNAATPAAKTAPKGSPPLPDVTAIRAAKKDMAIALHKAMGDPNGPFKNARHALRTPGGPEAVLQALFKVIQPQLDKIASTKVPAEVKGSQPWQALWLDLVSNAFEIAGEKYPDTFAEVGRVFRFFQMHESGGAAAPTVKRYVDDVRNDVAPFKDLVEQDAPPGDTKDLLSQEPGLMTGQRQIGFHYDEYEYRRVVAVQRELMVKGLLTNLSARKSREVFAGSADENRKISSAHPEFTTALARIDAVLEDPDEFAYILRSFPNSGNVLLQLQELRADLERRYVPETSLEVRSSNYYAVQVWHTDPIGLKFSGKDSRYGGRPYLAVAERLDGVLHIYVSRFHPNLAEALVHCFFQHCGAPSPQCVLLEALVATGKSGHPLLSDRIRTQIETSSYRELAGLVQRTEATKTAMKERNIAAATRFLLVQAAEAVCESAKKRLLQDVTVTQLRREVLWQDLENTRGTASPSAATGLAQDAEYAVQNLVVGAFSYEHRLAVLAVAMNTCKKLMAASGNRYGASIALFHDTMLRTARNAALNQLEFQVRDMNPFLIRESDLPVVYTEFIGLKEEEAQSFFGVSKFEVGEILYNRIRQTMVNENPHPNEFVRPKPMYEAPPETSLTFSTYVARYFEGLFFTFPTLFNLLLVLTTGYGVFTSNFISDKHKEVITYALLLSFVLTGGINNVIARLGSMYSMQWSHTTALIVWARTLSAGLLLVLTSTAVVAVILSIPGFRDIDAIVVFCLYSVLFSLFIMLAAALFNMHRGNVYSSSEGGSILFGQVIGFAVVMSGFVGFGIAATPEQYNEWGAAVHLFALLAAVLFMGWSYIRLVHRRTTYTDRIYVTPENDIVEWYSWQQGVLAPPPRGNDVRAYETATLAWYYEFQGLETPADSRVSTSTATTTNTTNSDGSSGDTVDAVRVELAKKAAEAQREYAREAFSSLVVRLTKMNILSRFFYKYTHRGDAIAVERAANFDAEDLLINWYVLLTAKAVPEPCTVAWDEMLKQADDAMSIKRKTDYLHRGGILWELMRTFFVHGMFYFALLFVDRFVQIFTGSQVSIFIPADTYETAVGWALIFLLLCAGAMEPLLARIAAFRDLYANRKLRLSRDGSLGYNALTRHDLEFERQVYWSELINFLVLSVVLFVATGAGAYGFGLWTNVYDPTDRLLWWSFAIACGGYFGFVLGAFHTVFLGVKHNAYAARAMVTSTVVGFSVGVLSTFVYPEVREATLSSLVVGCWLYAILVSVYLYRVRLETTGTFVAPIGPWHAAQISTSGQRWAGTPPAGRRIMSKLVLHLDGLTDTLGVTPSTHVGQEVTRILETTLAELRAAPKESVLLTAFPEADEKLSEILERWHGGQYHVVLVDESELRATKRHIFSAVSVELEAEQDGSVGQIVIFVGVNVNHSRRKIADLVATAVVHESYEQIWGGSHHYACASELLMIGNLDRLPARIERQLLASDNAELRKLELNTDEAVLDALLMGVDMDREWETLPEPSRAFVVSVLEKLNPDFGSDLVDYSLYPRGIAGLSADDVRVVTRSLCWGVTGKEVYADGAARLDADKAAREVAETKNLPTLIARSHLLASLARAINVRAAALREARMLPYSEEFDEIKGEPVLPKLSLERFSDSPLDDLKKFIDSDKKKGGWKLGAWVKLLQEGPDAFFRMMALGLMGDESFPMEYAWATGAGESEEPASIWFARAYYACLWPAWNVSRLLALWLTWTPVMRARPYLRELSNRINDGVNRTVWWSSGYPQYVHRYEGDASRTAFVSYDPPETMPGPPPIADGDNPVDVIKAVYGSRPDYMKHVTEVTVYKGIVWSEPRNAEGVRDKKGRVARLEYANGRLAKKLEYNASGDVEYTTFYSYGSVKDRSRKVWMPAQMKVYPGMHNDAPAEGESAVTEYEFDNLGQITGATLDRRVPAMEEAENIGELFTIHAEYTYAEDGAKAKSKRAAEPLLERAVLTGIRHDGKPETSGQLTVYWYLNSGYVRATEWIPRAGANPIYSTFIYRKIEHPEITTVERLPGGRERGHATPVFLESDLMDLLKKPPVMTVYDEDLLAPMGQMSVWRLPTTRLLWWWKKRRQQMFGEPIALGRYETRKARKLMWTAWKDGAVEGVLARIWDEYILRTYEPTLKKYWHSRNWGGVTKAREYILENQTKIQAAIYLEGTPKLRAHMAIRVEDLARFVNGGEGHDHLSPPDKYGQDSALAALREKDTLAIAGVDSGTWPADGGGVASCRRDVVDRLHRLRWTMYAEIGNPWKLMMYQVERNVDTLYLTPLWGTELGGPNETIHTTQPWGELSIRAWRTTDQVVLDYFVPILVNLILGINDPEPGSEALEALTTMFVNMHTYFQSYDWKTTWGHPVVWMTWRSMWIELENERAIESELLDAEMPTLSDLDDALMMVMHLMMPIAVPLKKLPVYHSTHHGLQAVIGAVAKRLYGSSFIVWDHGMAWRERLRALSELDFVGLFVRNILVGLSRVASTVDYHNADAIVSCSNVANPPWQLRIGGLKGHSGQESNMRRRMSPVVNGVEVDRFYVKRETEDERPTAVMLSHVYDLKDVKNAIRAAAVIVNQFKIKSFHLLVYGSLDKDPQYVTECFGLIALEGLTNNVTLAGLGAAPRVLPRGWVFVNSSKSEGLPLALGEAGAAGLPVVATDVGGSAEVVSDGQWTYGGLVPPNSPSFLARKILEVMAMLGDLEAAATPAGQNPRLEMRTLEDFTPEGLEERLKEASDARRRLGMRYRCYVLESFGLARYLREHEQLIWLGALQSKERAIQVRAIEQGLVAREEPWNIERHFVDVPKLRWGLKEESMLMEVFRPSLVTSATTSRIARLEWEVNKLQYQQLYRRKGYDASNGALPLVQAFPFARSANSGRRPSLMDALGRGGEGPGAPNLVLARGGAGAGAGAGAGGDLSDIELALEAQRERADQLQRALFDQMKKQAAAPATLAPTPAAFVGRSRGARRTSRLLGVSGTGGDHLELGDDESDLPPDLPPEPLFGDIELFDDGGLPELIASMEADEARAAARSRGGRGNSRRSRSSMRGFAAEDDLETIALELAELMQGQRTSTRVFPDHVKAALIRAREKTLAKANAAGGASSSSAAAAAKRKSARGSGISAAARRGSGLPALEMPEDFDAMLLDDLQMVLDDVEVSLGPTSAENVAQARARMRANRQDVHSYAAWDRLGDSGLDFEEDEELYEDELDLIARGEDLEASVAKAEEKRQARKSMRASRAKARGESKAVSIGGVTLVDGADLFDLEEDDDSADDELGPLSPQASGPTSRRGQKATKSLLEQDGNLAGRILKNAKKHRDEGWIPSPDDDPFAEDSSAPLSKNDLMDLAKLANLDVDATGPKAPGKADKATLEAKLGGKPGAPGVPAAPGSAPAPPPLPFAGNAPAPPPLPGMAAAPTWMFPNMPRPSEKMRRVYWIRIPNRSLERTVWGDLTEGDLMLHKIPYERFDKMFQVQDTVKDKFKALGGDADVIVDMRRARNVAIILNAFSKSHAETRRAILACDMKALTQYELTMLNTHLMPKEEESEKLLAYSGDVAKLGFAEKWFMSLLGVPRLRQRVGMMAFMAEFDTKVGELSVAMSAVAEACRELMTARGFAMMLRIILVSGNYLNGTTPQGVAGGFKLSSLPKLKDVRTADNKSNLLREVSRYVMEKEKAVVNFYRDLQSLTFATQVDSGQLANELTHLLSQATILSSELEDKAYDREGDGFKKTMKPFYTKAAKTIQQMTHARQNMTKILLKCASYFGEEDVESLRSEEFFSHVNIFVKDYRNEVKKIVEEAKEAARPKPKAWRIGRKSGAAKKDDKDAKKRGASAKKERPASGIGRITSGVSKSGNPTPSSKRKSVRFNPQTPESGRNESALLRRRGPSVGAQDAPAGRGLFGQATNASRREKRMSGLGMPSGDDEEDSFDILDDLDVEADPLLVEALRGVGNPSKEQKRKSIFGAADRKKLESDARAVGAGRSKPTSRFGEDSRGKGKGKPPAKSTTATTPASPEQPYKKATTKSARGIFQGIRRGSEKPKEEKRGWLLNASSAQPENTRLNGVADRTTGGAQGTSMVAAPSSSRAGAARAKSTSKSRDRRAGKPPAAAPAPRSAMFGRANARANGSVRLPPKDAKARAGIPEMPKKK